ncbi:MAG: Ig-like domain-containing protein [Candidatus Nealsonbacteria bacterium]|nr:Ig-like domain-containing protein [Candidatus Nealsonbacteria bacterium]
MRSINASRSGKLKFESLEPRMLLTGSIDGLKWLDLDVDGMRDSDEPGIPEWTIHLQGIRGGVEDGVADGGLWVTKTDKDGRYSFGNLPDGTYTVSEAMPDGWTQTFPGPRAELRDVETYPVGTGEAIDFRFISASVMDSTDPAGNVNRLPVEVTVEVAWPDWCWSVQPERTVVSVEGSQIDVRVIAQNVEFCPEIAGPKIERHTFTLPPLEPGQYSMAATLYEDNIFSLQPAPAPSLGTSGTLLLSAVGTHIVEVPGDPTFAPRHFDFGNVRPNQQPGPYIVSHDPQGEIPHPVSEVVVKFNEPIDPRTFTPEDVVVSIGFLEVYVPVFDVTAIDDATFLIEFAGSDIVGDYHVRVGPHIASQAGIEMDQDRDGRPGEPGDDVYDAGFVVVAPAVARVADQWPGPDTTEQLVSSVRVTFDEPMDPATINEDTFWVAGNSDGNVPWAEMPAAEMPPEMRVPGEVSYDETTLTAIFTPALERLPQGTYVVVAEDGITDRHGAPLDGEWSGHFPSGDGQPGGHYLTLFDVSDATAIRGGKWNDLNGNGLRDPDEPGLEDWTIYIDQNGNRQWDNGEPFDVTGPDGAYAIEIAPGRHTVAEQAKPGWEQTFPWIDGGPQFRVDTGTSGFEPAVAADAEGNFVVAWIGGSGFVPVISARMFRADGTPLADEFQVNARTIPHSQPTVARDAAGNFVIGWIGREANAESPDVYARTYDAHGNPHAPEQRINTTTAGQQSMASAAMAPDGAFVIAWVGPGSNTDPDNQQQFDVFARVFHGDPSSLSGEFQVNTFTSTGQWSAPSAAMDRSGNVAIAWAGTTAESHEFGRIYTRLFDRAGRAADVEFRVDTTDWDGDSGPLVAMDAGGNFAVVWNSDDMTDGPGYADVHGQVFYAGGTARGKEFQVNSDGLAASYHASLAMDATGDFVVAWTGENWNENRNDVYARMFLADGTPIGQELVANADVEGTQLAPAVAMGNADRFVVAWAGGGETNAGDIFARQFRGFGSIAVHEVLVHGGQAVERVDFGNKIDKSGPRIVHHTPSGTIPLPSNQMDVRFNEAINEKTFTTDDVTVRADHLRLYIPVTGIHPLGDNSYRITFDGPGIAIDYHVAVGPHVEDFAGNEMDQNRDGTPGTSDDVYDAWFIVAHAAGGGIQGSKWYDRNGNGTWENNEPGLPGWTIYLDEDNDGRLDPTTPGLSGTIEPDNYALGQRIIDPAGFVQLSEGPGHAAVVAAPSLLDDPALPTENVFGWMDAAGEPRAVWSETDSVLELTFAKPVSLVSLDFIGPYRGVHQGRMRLFDPAGKLLEERFTSEILGPNSETLTVVRGANEIARVEVTGVAQLAPLMLDHLEFAVQLDPGEPWTQTDEHGDYEFAGLQAGTYVVAEVLQEGWRQTSPPPRAELVDAGSQQIGDGAALGFGISDVQIPPHTAEYPWPVDSAAIDVTLEVVWPSTHYGLQRDATTFAMEGDVVVIDLYGAMLHEIAMPVVWTESQTVTIPFPQSGEYTIHATLHESLGPMLPAFVATWEEVGEMIAQGGGRHVVRLPGGEIARDVDFGNRRIPWIDGRHLFYNNSDFDNGVQELGGDDPVAPSPETASDPSLGKTALLPGQVANFQNYTSYDKGINGLIIDVAGLPETGETVAAADYFQFRVGNDSDPAGWTEAPSPLAVAVHVGGGANDSDRLAITFSDYAIRNQWLEVTVLANEHTGLTEPDVFYFGNAVADAGNSPADTQVTAADLLLARNNPRDFLHPAGVDCPYDFNRDGQVNAMDVLLARNNQTSFLNALNLIDLSEGMQQAQESPATDLAWLAEFNQTVVNDRPAQEDAAAAVDQLLATYWP